MQQVLNAHHLRVYDLQRDPAQTGVKSGGFSTLGMRGDGYVVLDAAWTDVFFDQNKYGIQQTVLNGVATQVKVNLQFTLAHEADHLRGAGHLDPSRTPDGVATGGKGWLTKNSVKCGGLGS